jgi:class 3 adenylate cyclase
MAAKKKKVIQKRQPTFRAALSDAEGRSEFIIAIFVDIRAFSRFSKKHESPDTAMLIKRFYLNLIDDYFSGATFFKPTGDGLLVVYPYKETTLISVASEAVSNSIRCLESFPEMLKDDPMINFEPPENLGFGIARGTACCLHMGKTVIDYSGHLLNLSARLMELARPSGIVIDGAFGFEVIPESLRDNFSEENVYIRSLAEKEPKQIFYLNNAVKISSQALTPLESFNWRTHKRSFKVKDLRKIGQFFLIHLDETAAEDEEIKVTLTYPMMRNGRPVKGYLTNHKFNKFTVVNEPDETIIRCDFFAAAEVLESEKVPKTREITFKIDYRSK